MQTGRQKPNSWLRQFKQFFVALFARGGTMWKAVVLAVCLFVAGVQPLEDPTYGVKLCGREFIRAVIFTCGGSRWRRSLRSADASEDPFSSHQEESTEGLNNFVVDSFLQRNRDLSFTSRDDHEGAFSRPARSFITDEILEALRKADRKGRDVVVGLSNACCKWGCSKSEISSLC
ncbi:relaxin-3a [Parambassis ranga]|uniref:Relaxin-3 n=1 Tax=Parambassis ranga TaxID=210632 RepID=A0A6P7IVD6_9TELE|nr:relaxin-3-like [Parambassis ranga]